MELPVSVQEVKEKDPKELVVFSQPKMGKTTIVAELTKQLKGRGLIINLENGGTDYVEGVYINCYTSSTCDYLEAFSRYREIINTLRREPGKYDYIIIDSLTVLDEWSDIAGTYAYMSSNQGKNFNKDVKTGKTYNHSDLEWKSVTSLGEGNKLPLCI